MTQKTSGGSEGPILNIVGERVALGPLRSDLLPLYQRWINDFDTVRTIGLRPGPVTVEAEREWYESQAKSEDDVPFTIYEIESLRPIGNTGLHGVDYRNSRATFGILIGEADYRGRGYGTEATRLMLDYAFTALGINNVMLTVFENNAAGIRAYEKAGFKEFGRRRECRAVGGRMWDEVYMDCLRGEFESPVVRRAFAPEDQR